MVLKDENGAVITDGGEGILWIRGHSSTPQFWNRPDRTAQTIQQDGWLCTCDRFIRDNEGFYFYRGRTGDLVKISGQWVNPIEVECCLSDHPAVRECAVLAVAMPDRSVESLRRNARRAVRCAKNDTAIAGLREGHIGALQVPRGSFSS
jgi:acetyl-CoA synthetase